MLVYVKQFLFTLGLKQLASLNIVFYIIVIEREFVTILFLSVLVHNRGGTLLFNVYII